VLVGLVVVTMRGIVVGWDQTTKVSLSIDERL